MVESIHKSSTAYNPELQFSTSGIVSILDEFNNKNCTQIKANISQVFA